MKKKDNPPHPPWRKTCLPVGRRGRGNLKGISCYLSEIQDIPKEIEEGMYRRDDGENQIR
jgi:hypothetical protein